MKYEALYAAVLSAAPTVLIGFVLETRFLMNQWKSNPPRNARWLIYAVIIGTSLSGILSLAALSTAADYGDNVFYAALVTFGLMMGILGLTVFMVMPFAYDAKEEKDAL